MAQDYIQRTGYFRAHPDEAILAFMIEYGARHHHGSFFTASEFSHIKNMSHGGYGIDGSVGYAETGASDSQFASRFRAMAEPSPSELDQCVAKGWLEKGNKGQKLATGRSEQPSYRLTPAGEQHYYQNVLPRLKAMNPEIYSEIVYMDDVVHAVTSALGAEDARGPQIVEALRAKAHTVLNGPYKGYHSPMLVEHAVYRGPTANGKAVMEK